MAEEADRDEGGIVGDSVAVIGAGLVGIEAAIHQALRGKKVSIIEALPAAARDANFRYARTYKWKMEELGIQLFVNTKCEEITPEGVRCTDAEGKPVFVPADTEVIAIGMRPRENAAEALRDCAPEFRRIGNCVKIGQVMDSIRAGFDAGMFTE